MLANMMVALIVIAAGAHFYKRYLKSGRNSGCGTGSGCNSCNACETHQLESEAAPNGRRVIHIQQHKR